MAKYYNAKRLLELLEESENDKSYWAIKPDSFIERILFAYYLLLGRVLPIVFLPNSFIRTLHESKDN